MLILYEDTHLYSGDDQGYSLSLCRPTPLLRSVFAGGESGSDGVRVSHVAILSVSRDPGTDPASQWFPLPAPASPWLQHERSHECQ